MTSQEKKAYLYMDLYEGKDGQTHLDAEGDGTLLDLALMLCILKQDYPEIFEQADEMYDEMRRHFSALNDNNFWTRN